MKHIRNILLLITIIFGFVMQAEVYQNMLWNFNGAYYLSSQYTSVDNDLDSFIADAEKVAQEHNVHIFSTFNRRVSNYQTRLSIYGDDATIRDSLKNKMDIEEKTYTALISGITIVEFENFNEVKNTGNGQAIMLSYIGDNDDVIATYQDLAETYSITQPEFWQSTETDMMFIVWGLVAILMIVLNVVEVIRRQKEVVVRASLGESAAIIALKSAVVDIISYIVLFVLAKLLVAQFISGAYENKLVLAVYCIGAVLSVVHYCVFVRFDVRKALAFVLFGSFMLSGCSKDEILNHYNNIVQSAGSIELTGKSSLQGEKEKGIDDYTGTYTADYANFSGTEYLFGGTSIKREAGKELSIDCTLEITEGTAKVFWISGSDEAVTLIEATGTYSDTITLPDGGNYIGIECESFTGSIELNIE